MAVRFFLTLLLLSTHTSAFSTFETNCTLPTDTVSYVSSPNTRGTLTILWACLFTIISCTWTVQHPDVPWQRYHFKKGFKGTVTWATRKYAAQGLWFVLTILAPEVLLTKYLLDIWEAKKDLEKFQELAAEDGVEWTLAHSLFANMGGFIFKFRLQPREQGEQEEGNKNELESDAPPLMLYSKLLDAFWILEYRKYRYFISQNAIERPVAQSLVNAVEDPSPPLLPRLPAITEDELWDRSKSDALLRIITVVQILWMCVQVIVRASGGLAVSQLKVSVVAFACCAVVMYGLSWNKPKGVQVPISICHSSADDCAGPMSGAASPGRRPADNGLVQIVQQVERKSMRSMLSNALDFPVDVMLSGSSVLGAVLGGSLFGGIHLIAWDFAFPTIIERTLWRVTALYCTFVPIGFGLLVLPLYLNRPAFLSKVLKVVEPFLAWADDGVIKTLGGGSLLLVLILYVLARLYLLVEMFRTLAYLPPDAYLGTWTVNMPFFG